LQELGHAQPATPLQTDNAMADAVINGKIQQTKAMDMRFHWLCDQECQQQFHIYWQPGRPITLTTGPNTTLPNIIKKPGETFSLP
jgi:hypothetical protein